MEGRRENLFIIAQFCKYAAVVSGRAAILLREWNTSDSCRWDADPLAPWRVRGDDVRACPYGMLHEGPLGEHGRFSVVSPQRGLETETWQGLGLAMPERHCRTIVLEC